MLIICRTIMCIWCASCAYQLCMKLIEDRQEYRLEVLRKLDFNNEVENDENRNDQQG